MTLNPEQDTEVQRLLIRGSEKIVDPPGRIGTFYVLTLTVVASRQRFLAKTLVTPDQFITLNDLVSREPLRPYGLMIASDYRSIELKIDCDDMYLLECRVEAILSPDIVRTTANKGTS